MDKRLEEVYRHLNQYTPVETSLFEQFTANAHFVSYPKNTTLAEDVIGFVVSGIVRSYHITQKGEEFNKNFFVPNDFFMCSLQEDAYNITLESVTDSEIILFDGGQVSELFSTSSDAANLLQAMMMEYTTESQKRNTELLSLGAKERYILFLKRFENFHENIPQYHIASYLGITPTQLSRIKR